MEYLSKYTQNSSILYGATDYSGRLGIYDTFKECMELAGIHAKKLDMAQNDLMKRGLFWLTVKTRIRFYPENKPLMGAPVTEETWPRKPLSFKTDRYYRISNESGLVAEGITEWAIMDFKNGRLANIPPLFPEDLVFSDEELSFSGFPVIKVHKADSEEAEVRGTYKVTSSDIDAGLHMNNAAYIRALLGFFSVDELKEMEIQEMTAIFKKSAHEGDVLTMPVMKDGNVINTGLYFEDGSPAFLAQIITK